MSFRKYGGINRAPANNIIKNHLPPKKYIKWWKGE